MGKKLLKNNLIALGKISPQKLFILGLFLIGVSFIWSLYPEDDPSFLSSPTPIVSQKVESYPIPIKLAIPSKSIDLPVKETTITGGKWQISSKEASHLQASASPGESGNIIIYGHNKSSILGKITGLKKGDLIFLTTADNKKHQYQVIDRVTVSPSQIEVLNPTTEEILTLYTCTGFLDSKRLVIKALPVQADLKTI